MHLFRRRFGRHERHSSSPDGLRGRFGALWDAARFHRRAAWVHSHVHGEARGRDIAERVQDHAAAFLDLNDGQADLMSRVFDSLATLRRGAKALSRRDDVTALVDSETFDRDAAQALFDQQLDALKAAGPGLIADFGDFFDALDFEQQQMLRFALRRRGGHRGHRHHHHPDGHPGRRDGDARADDTDHGFAF